jgi:pyruvate,water dikinase
VAVAAAPHQRFTNRQFCRKNGIFSNINGQLAIARLRRCYASLFTDRAIKYRHDMNFTKLDIAISVGVQQMVRSDKASSGVAFTIDPDGFEKHIIINGCWGLGENIVQGTITPDEWMILNPLYKTHLNPC